MKAEIIAVGTELLMGELVDSNSTYLASELPTVGVELRLVSKVGDDIDDLANAISSALSRSDLLITTGGLGPTSDDLTRESIARFFNEEMVVKNDLLQDLKKEFEKRGTDMPQTNIKQASLINSATSIPNPRGTAPGWFVHKDGKTVVALPGPPLELIPMWNDHVKSKIQTLTPEVFIKTETVKSFGISEGELDEIFSHLFSKVNPFLGIYSKQDGIHLRAIASASNEGDATAILEPVMEEIKTVIGNSIWGTGDDSLPEVLAKKLIDLDMTFCVVEGFTGGQLCSLINDSVNANRQLTGGLIHSSEKQKKHKDKFDHLEDKLNSLILETHADIGLLVSNPVPNKNNPQSAGKVIFKILDGTDIKTIEANFRSGSPRMKQRAANQALLELINHLSYRYKKTNITNNIPK